MKLIYFFLFSPLLFSFIVNEKTQQTDWEKYGFWEKVKSMKETRYYAKVKDSAIIKEEITDNSYASYEILFNSVGFITEYHANYPKKSINTYKLYTYWEDKVVLIREYNAKGELKSKEVFEYNKQESVTEQASYRDEKFFEKRSYSYDKNENLVSIVYKNQSRKKNKKWEYSYDGNGKKAESFLTDGKIKKNNNWKEKHFYKYNEAGKLICDSAITFPDKFSEKTIYKYNNAGKRTDVINYNDIGEINWSTNYKYDADGNISELTNYDNVMGLKHTDTTYHKYIYDAKGNWIQKTSYDTNLFPTIITERIFEYY